MEEFKYSIDKDEINDKPLGKFEGRIDIVDSKEKLFEAINILEKHSHIGFDTESRPSFRKGEHHPVALIQLAVDDYSCLVRINQLEDITPLKKIISNDNIAKIGLGLSRELTELLEETGLKCRHFIDLERIAAENKFKQRGVRALAAFFLNIRISKGAQKSNWERADLTEAQKTYAATDAWVCLQIYNKMVKQNFVNKDDIKQFLSVENLDDQN